MCTLALQPLLQPGHCLGSRRARLGEVVLRRAVLHRSKDLWPILAEELDVAPEVVDTALHEARGKRRTQVGTDVRGEPGDSAQIADVAAHARGERGVVAIQIDLGVER